MPTKRNQDLLDLRQPSDKKASKPLMEKRRRARINHSLAQLKALVIDPNTTERTRQAKLEKADILELTVRHLYEIKRQQRTAVMLETRHPKKKFEIGYSECAREVELFLSNLINPQSSGVDGELQRRLKDHLNKRLQDFKNIEPLESNSKKEASDEELNSEEPTSSPSSSVSNCLDDVPLSADTEETDSSDSSALSTMLKYYADDKKSAKRQDISTSGENPSPKRLKKANRLSNEEESGLSFSCQSVSSTTGCKPPDVPPEVLGVEKYSDSIRSETMAKTYALKECFSSEASDLSDSPHVIYTNFRSSALKRKSYISTSTNASKKEPTDYFDYVPSDIYQKGNKNGQPTNTRSQKLTEQIPLVPRQLANGDWALVLPASLVPSEKEESSYPFSAFRLVVPTNSTSSDPDIDCTKQRLHSSSPLSSTVSDMSIEEFCSRSNGDPAERPEHGSPDSTQMVWRPW